MILTKEKEDGITPTPEEQAMIDPQEYKKKYKRFVQGLISEDEFRTFLTLSLSKSEMIDIIVTGAKSLRRVVAIGEHLQVKR